MHHPRFRAPSSRPEACSREIKIETSSRRDRMSKVIYRPGQLVNYQSSVNERKGILRFTVFRSQSGRSGARTGEDRHRGRGRRHLRRARRIEQTRARTRRERLRGALSRLARTNGRIITPLRVARARGREMARGDGASASPMLNTSQHAARADTRNFVV